MRSKLTLLLGLAIVVGAVAGLLVYKQVDATVFGNNILVSYDSTGTAPSNNLGDQLSHISEDGNIIAWTSAAHDVISGDPLPAGSGVNIYIKNIQTGITSFANTDISGIESGAVDTNYFVMSRTGRYVVYSSSANDIVLSPSVPNNLHYHAYLKDMQTGTTVLVDKSAVGILANQGGTATTGYTYPTAVSDDGRFVVFGSRATNLLTSGNPSSPNYTTNYYVKDLITGEVINPVLSTSGGRANQRTGEMLASCDGAIMTFGSTSTNLTPQDTGSFSTFIADFRKGGTITNIGYGANQDAYPMSISCNGRYIVIESKATNLTADTVSGTLNHWFRYDRLTGSTVLVDKSTSGYISSTKSPYGTNGLSSSRQVSDDGKVVFYSDDHAMISPAASNNYEVYLRNPETGITELVPINSSGVEQNPAPTSTAIRDTIEINAVGNKVIYNSRASNLVSGITTTVSNKLILSEVR